MPVSISDFTFIDLREYLQPESKYIQRITGGHPKTSRQQQVFFFKVLSVV